MLNAGCSMVLPERSSLRIGRKSTGSPTHSKNGITFAINNRMMIRNATREDVPAMVGLLGELFALEPDFPFRPDLHIHGLNLLLNTTGALALVATPATSHEPIAMITLQPHISTGFGIVDGIVEDFVVSGKYRGQGIGSQLLERLEATAKVSGYTRLRLYADRENTTALEFYQRKQWNLGRMTGLYRTLTSHSSTEL